MVKDSKKYASTGGWGYADFTNGKPGNEALHLREGPRRNGPPAAACGLWRWEDRGSRRSTASWAR
jgi:hypothetical protein